MKCGSIHHIPGLHPKTSLCTRVCPGRVGTDISIFCIISGMNLFAYYTTARRCLKIIIRGIVGFLQTLYIVIDTHTPVNWLVPLELGET